MPGGARHLVVPLAHLLQSALLLQTAGQGLLQMPVGRPGVFWQEVRPPEQAPQSALALQVAGQGSLQVPLGKPGMMAHFLRLASH